MNELDEMYEAEERADRQKHDEKLKEVNEKFNVKLEKVDERTAYENLLIKYAELEKENAELKKTIEHYRKEREFFICEVEK